VTLVANSMFGECSGLNLPESTRMGPFRPPVALLPQAIAGNVANSVFEKCSRLNFPGSIPMGPFRLRLVLLPHAMRGKAANSGARRAQY